MTTRARDQSRRPQLSMLFHCSQHLLPRSTHILDCVPPFSSNLWIPDSVYIVIPGFILTLDGDDNAAPSDQRRETMRLQKRHLLPSSWIFVLQTFGCVANALMSRYASTWLSSQWMYIVVLLISTSLQVIRLTRFRYFRS